MNFKQRWLKAEEDGDVPQCCPECGQYINYKPALKVFSDYKKELGEEINGMGFKDPNEAGQFAMHADGYNQAIEEILTLLQKDKENK